MLRCFGVLLVPLLLPLLLLLLLLLLRCVPAWSEQGSVGDSFWLLSLLGPAGQFLP